MEAEGQRVHLQYKLWLEPNPVLRLADKIYLLVNLNQYSLHLPNLFFHGLNPRTTLLQGPALK